MLVLYVYVCGTGIPGYGRGTRRHSECEFSVGHDERRIPESQNGQGRAAEQYSQYGEFERRSILLPHPVFLLITADLTYGQLVGAVVLERSSLHADDIDFRMGEHEIAACSDRRI